MKYQDILESYAEQDIACIIQRRLNELDYLIKTYNLKSEINGHEITRLSAEELLNLLDSEEWYLNAIAIDNIKLQKAIANLKVAKSKMRDKIKFGL
jgi:hypothetical protein